MGQPKVFISYSKQPEEHAAQVRELWLFLLDNGVDASIDLPAESERQEWPNWMRREMESADFVIVVASAAYRRHAEQGMENDTGRGVNFEASMLQDLLYQDRETWFRKLLPVLLPGESRDGIPRFLAPYSGTVYPVEQFTQAGAIELLRVLTGQPEYRPRTPGPQPHLPAFQRPGAMTVCFIGASPFDIALGTLRADREFQAIRRAARPGALTVAAATVSNEGDIGGALRRQPNAVHISGRCRPSDVAIALEHPDDSPRLITLNSLASRIAMEKRQRAAPLRLLTFSVDHSAEFLDRFRGLADVVIGWRGEIGGECSVAFSAEFYGALARDPRADRAGCARRAARDISDGGCGSDADALVVIAD